MAALRPHPERDPLSGEPARIASPCDTELDPAPLPEPAGPGAYVHVPFCRVRCPYCDFATRPYRPAEVPRLAAALAREARERLAAAPVFGSLYLGGGTPSRLEPEAFVELVRGLEITLTFVPGHERSLEANPEDLDPARLGAWRSAGFTRLSIGVQSLLDDELRRLGRVHDARAVPAGVARARGAGFEDLNLDLMYGYPGHTVERFGRSLEAAPALGPDHVSAYAFTPEAGTVLGDAVRAGRMPRRGEDDEANLFERARDALEAAGYRHYEVSNFARAGRFARHHLNYWRRGDYLGLGPAAVSALGGRRASAPRDLPDWAAEVEAGRAVGPWPPGWQVDDARPHALFETVFLGLRLDTGMRFADAGTEVLPDALHAWRSAGERLEARGLLKATAGGFRLPRALRALADAVAQAWRAEAEHGRTSP